MEFKNNPSLKYQAMALILILAISWVYFFAGWSSNIYLLFAAILWMYMAMNIGANDVANNMGPAVWSKALTLTWAIIVAAIFEASGAIIAGGDVVDTIKGEILHVSMINDSQIYISIMMATLLGAALWINIATFFKAPVSATHSIIGWLIWAGMAAAGYTIVDWSQIGTIAASWVISPVMWGTIAAIIMLSIRHTILKKDDVGEAAKRWVPIFIGLMAWVFATYLILKGLTKIIHINIELAVFVGYVIWVISYFGVGTYLRKHKSLLKNSKKFVNRLFNIPLIFAVALLSFAHGANDVANAIWPLVAINNTILSWWIQSVKDVGIPFWIMVIWAIGLSTGLIVFGARLINTVGGEITKLNQIRAFSVALAAAITVIIASNYGLPVSSTHIAIGWIFGVGLTREYIKRRNGKDKNYVARWMIKTIALAWVITLPISGSISAWVYYILMKI